MENSMNINIEDTSKKLYEYLSEVVQLSETEMFTIKSAMRMVREIAPSDAPLLIKKINELISISQDLSWVVSVVSRKKHKIVTEVRIIKDPTYVMLVRQGRPSIAAIESEIRLNNNKIYKMEEDIEILDNISDYLKHLEQSIDRYIWLAKDKMSFSR